MYNDLISREYVEKIIISEVVDLQDGTENWRTYVNETCENILNKVHNAPTVEKRPKSEWVCKGVEEGALGIRYEIKQCKNCGFEHSLCIPKYFCPNCGAEMEVEK